MNIIKAFIWGLLIAVFISISIYVVFLRDNGKIGFKKQKSVINEKIELKSNHSEIDTIDLKKKIEAKNEPCKVIQEFVSKIEQNGWIHDNERLKKISAYDNLRESKMHYFNGKPYYKIEFNNTHFKKLHKDYENRIKESDYLVLQNVNSIWSYFYREQKNSNLITDGIIEQWEFLDNDIAKKAIIQMMKMSDMISFNTTPYFCKLDNKVIVFYSRASNFSIIQKSIYKQFINENKFKCEQFNIKSDFIMIPNIEMIDSLE